MQGLFVVHFSLKNSRDEVDSLDSYDSYDKVLSPVASLPKKLLLQYKNANYDNINKMSEISVPDIFKLMLFPMAQIRFIHCI